MQNENLRGQQPRRTWNPLEKIKADMLQNYNELEGPNKTTIWHERDRELNYKASVTTWPKCKGHVFESHVKKVKAEASESSNDTEICEGSYNVFETS